MSTDVVIDRTKSTYFMQLQSEYFTTVFTAASTTGNVNHHIVSHTTMVMQCNCYNICSFTNRDSTSRRQYHDSCDSSSCGVGCDYRHHHHDHTNHHIHLAEEEPQEHSLSKVSCCEQQWWDSGVTTEWVLHDYQRRHTARV